MIVDSFIEWFVIGTGMLIAINIIFPNLIKFNVSLPHPTKVRKWLNKHGL